MSRGQSALWCALPLLPVARPLSLQLSRKGALPTLSLQVQGHGHLAWLVMRARLVLPPPASLACRLEPWPWTTLPPTSAAGWTTLPPTSAAGWTTSPPATAVDACCCEAARSSISCARALCTSPAESSTLATASLSCLSRRFSISGGGTTPSSRAG